MGPVLQREADTAFRRDVGSTHRDGAMPGIAGGRWRYEACAGKPSAISWTWTSSWPPQPLSNTKDLEFTRRVV
jgi:hypothetical protein